MAVVQYTFTHKQYIEQHNRLEEYRKHHSRHKQYIEQHSSLIIGIVRTVPRLCEVYLDICFTTEEKARTNLCQGSRRMPVGKSI
jgi:hypothetical protein